MSSADLKIDLSEHKNPEEFVQELSKKYPDSNVKLTLLDNVLYVDISSEVPLQQKINILSFLDQKARETIHWSW